MASLLFPLQFERQYSGPLDQDQVFTTTSARLTYLTNPLRYAGQIVTDLETEKTYQLNAAKDTWIELGGSGGSSDIIDLTFKTAYTTYYHELKYDSVSSNLSAIQIYEDNTKVTHLFEKLLTYTSTALLTGISITDKVNNNTLTKTLSYDGSDNLISTTRIYT